MSDKDFAKLMEIAKERIEAANYTHTSSEQGTIIATDIP